MYDTRGKVYDLSFGMYFLCMWCTRECCNWLGRTAIIRDSRFNHICNIVRKCIAQIYDPRPRSEEICGGNISRAKRGIYFPANFRRSRSRVVYLRNTLADYGSYDIFDGGRTGRGQVHVRA